MSKFYQGLAIAAAGAILGLNALANNSAQASILTYELRVEADREFSDTPQKLGQTTNVIPLESYHGWFSIDDVNITDTGVEFIEIVDLEFTYQENTYTKNYGGLHILNPLFSSPPVAVIEDGQLLGINYGVRLSDIIGFQFAVGFNNLGYSSSFTLSRTRVDTTWANTPSAQGTVISYAEACPLNWRNTSGLNYLHDAPRFNYYSSSSSCPEIKSSVPEPSFVLSFLIIGSFGINSILKNIKNKSS